MLTPNWLAFHGQWLWWAAFALAIAAGWWAERGVRRRLGRRAWRARAGAWRRVRIDAEPGSTVRVRGTLRVEGRAAERFEDGAPAAVASAAAGPRTDRDADCVSVRAERVWLDTAGGSIELRGAIEVVGGRTVRAAGTPSGSTWHRIAAALGNEGEWTFTSLAVELRSVAHGDTVEVCGVLERALDGDTAGYRSASGRVIVPSEGPILLQLEEPAPARAWRGPLAALAAFAIANVLVVPAEARGSNGWLALACPITRPHARERLERELERSAELALAHRAPMSAHHFELAMALSELTCVERARLLRAADRAEDALTTARRCEGLEAERERALALFALGREREAMGTWSALLSRLDAECAWSERAAALVELSTEPTPVAWGEHFPSLTPQELVVGSAHPHRPHVAERLHRLLAERPLRCPSMRIARTSWTLELALFEIAVDQLDRAAALLDDAQRWLTAEPRPLPVHHALAHDIDHLRIALLLQQRGTALRMGAGEIEHAAALLHAADSDRWAVTRPCVMEGIVATARDPFSPEVRLDLAALPAYQRVRDFFLRPNPEVHGASRWTGDPQGLAWVEHFVRADASRQGPGRRHDGLSALIPDPRTCDGDASEGAALADAVRARAHAALGDASRAARIRACVARAREELLARPPLERHR